MENSRTRARRSARFRPEALEPRTPPSDLLGHVPAPAVASEPEVPETGPDPDGEPPVDVPPPPFGPVLPARPGE